MVRGWGASKFYTIPQVRAGLREAGLGSRYVAIAYAGLLSEEDFRQTLGEHPVRIRYDEARRWFRGGRPGDQPMPYAFAADGDENSSWAASYGPGADGGGGDGGGGGD